MINSIRKVKSAALLRSCVAAHSRPCAATFQLSIPRICIVCHITALPFDLAQECKHRLRARSHPLTVLAGAISFSIGVVGKCPIGWPIGFALQPARVHFSPAPTIPARDSTPRPEPGVCGCGRCTCGEPSGSHNQWFDSFPVPARGGVHHWSVYVLFPKVRSAWNPASGPRSSGADPCQKDSASFAGLYDPEDGPAKSREVGAMAAASRSTLASNGGGSARESFSLRNSKREMERQAARNFSGPLRPHVRVLWNRSVSNAARFHSAPLERRAFSRFPQLPSRTWIWALKVVQSTCPSPMRC